MMWSIESRKARMAFVVVALIGLVLGAAFMVWPPSAGEEATLVEPDSNVPAEVRARIDKWIADRSLNRYGDPPNTKYAGASPLFDPRSGKMRDRYEYILDKHPELRGN